MCVFQELPLISTVSPTGTSMLWTAAGRTHSWLSPNSNPGTQTFYSRWKCIWTSLHCEWKLKSRLWIQTWNPEATEQHVLQSNTGNTCFLSFLCCKSPSSGVMTSETLNKAFITTMRTDKYNTCVLCSVFGFIQVTITTAAGFCCHQISCWDPGTQWLCSK